MSPDIHMGETWVRVEGSSSEGSLRNAKSLPADNPKIAHSKWGRPAHPGCLGFMHICHTRVCIFLGFFM